MGDGDGPAEATSRVVPLRGRAAPRRGAPLLSPADVARRLAALERQVEEALGAERVGRSALRVDGLLEDALAAYASARAFLADEAAGLASTLLGELSLLALRRWWWRVDVVGRERLPEGATLVVANRGSTLLPYDALMAAVALGGPDGGVRRVRPFVDEWLTSLPLVGLGLSMLGAEPAGVVRVRHALEAAETAIVFPEGREAVARPYAEAYRVGRFTRAAILRLAIERGVPIVPVAIIGVDEVHPVLARIPLPRLLSGLGVPAVPVTPTLVPLPTKWRLFVGDPYDTAGRHRPVDARDPAVVRTLADRLRERLQGVVSDGLRRRRSLFL